MNAHACLFGIDYSATGVWVCVCVKVLRDEQECTLRAHHLVWHQTKIEVSTVEITSPFCIFFSPCLPNLRRLHKISLITSALVAPAKNDGAGINR